MEIEAPIDGLLFWVIRTVCYSYSIGFGTLSHSYLVLLRIASKKVLEPYVTLKYKHYSVLWLFSKYFTVYHAQLFIRYYFSVLQYISKNSY